MNASLLTPSLVRAALDELLRWHPAHDVVWIDWQVTSWYRSGVAVPNREHTGPWVLVELGQPSEAFDTTPAWAVLTYAIWKRTGAIHDLVDGAVSDDPIWSPASLRVIQ